MKRTVGLERYYTASEVAADCVEFLSEQYNMISFDNIVEPSSGDGSFADHLPSKTITIDIDQNTPAKIHKSFLEYEPPHGKTLVIGNPPFGARSSMAFQFLHHAADFADVIAFILPNSFHGTNFSNRVPEYFHLVQTKDVSGMWGDNYLNLTFFVYEKRAERRHKVVEQTEHKDFDMVHAHLAWIDELEFDNLKKHYEFAMSQAGSIKVKDLVDLPKRGSHFFVRGLVPGVRKVFESMSFDGGSNVAHKSLSKAEIIKQYKSLTEDA